MRGVLGKCELYVERDEYLGRKNGWWWVCRVFLDGPIKVAGWLALPVKRNIASFIGRLMKVDLILGLVWQIVRGHLMRATPPSHYFANKSSRPKSSPPGGPCV